MALDTPGRISYRRDEPTPTGLSCHVALPGGPAVVDLLDPAHPYLIEMDTERATDDLIAHLAPGPGVGLPVLPDPWTRLALVTGVDRWFELPPDIIPRFSESVLHADLALAHRGVGNSESADHYFDAARPALEWLVDRVPAEGALFDEFALIFSQAPFGCSRDELVHRRTSRTGVEIVDEPVMTAGLTSGIRTRGSRPVAVAVNVDPRSVPGRVLIADTASALRDGDVISVSVNIFPDVAASPISGRLFARLLVGEVTVGLGSLTYRDGVAEASLRVPPDLTPTVDLFDSATPGGPYVGEESRDVAWRLGDVRTAWSWKRLAHAAAAFGRDIESSIAAEAADSAAARQPRLRLPERINDPLVGGGTGAVRPLLAELVAEIGLAIHA